MSERFYLPEEKIQSISAEDAEKANTSAKNQMKFTFFVALLACLFIGQMCYQDAGSFTATSFLIYVAIATAFLFGLWKFNQQVIQNEQIKNAEKQILYAQELFLSENDITWEIKKTTPEKIVIAWENITAYDGLIIEHEVNGRKEKTKTPRVIHHNRDVFIEFLEKYTKLKKVIKEGYSGGEKISFTTYEK
jgi:hypothetical protein